MAKKYPDTKELNEQFKNIINEIDIALEIMNVEVKKEKWFRGAKKISILKFKMQLIEDNYYQYLNKLYIKANTQKSGYEEFPLKMEERGYVYLFTNDGEKFIAEHRYLIQKELGRRLNYNEIIHHIDGNKSNNKIENLKIMTRSEHSSMHAKTIQRKRKKATVKG